MVVLLQTFTSGCKKDSDSSTTSVDSTITDVDGNVYHTLVIGDQVWLVENLKTTHYNDGTEIPCYSTVAQWNQQDTIGAYCNYNNSDSIANIYGRLYNYWAVKTEKLAPTGWRVATNSDWAVLVNYLIENEYNYDSTTTYDYVAKSLASTLGWATSTTTGNIGNKPSLNNRSGFTAIPGGRRTKDNGYAFTDLGKGAYWWTSTVINSNYVWYWFLEYTDNSSNQSYSYYKNNGYTVRCVLDD
jgi:uncharacterized protein (TIGR02145 family)